MTTSILRTARFALLLAAGFVLGLVAIAVTSASSGKSSFWHAFGISSASANEGTLAVTSCDMPSKDTSDDVYFVSCGGFF